MLISFATRPFLAPIPGLVATVIGIALGGFVAGKWAKTSGFYHGACVAVGWIALEILGAVPTMSYASDALADTVLVIALDVVTLLAGSIGGYFARPGPLSSSDTGRGR